MTHRFRLLREAGIVLAAFAVLAITGFFAQRFLFSRPVLAPDLESSIDNALRPVMLQQIRSAGSEIRDPEVVRAFSAMTDRLLPSLAVLAPKSPRITVVLIDSPVINAFTLPGGVVCVCSGLARALDSGDEMAAVLGHELGHVAKRDPLALLARRIGLSALTAVLTGGQGGTLGQGIMQELVNARYSRKAEDRADGFAVDLLASSGLAPTSFAAALRRIKETTPKSPALLQYLDPHSPVDQRIRHVEERARKASARGRWGTTGMSPLTVDWTAVVEALSAGGKTSRGE